MCRGWRWCCRQGVYLVCRHPVPTVWAEPLLSRHAYLSHIRQINSRANTFQRYEGAVRIQNNHVLIYDPLGFRQLRRNRHDW